MIVATGPLTSDALSRDVARLVGGDHLYFYDAISPIVLAESIDMSKVFRASRWGAQLCADTRAGHSGVPEPSGTATARVPPAASTMAKGDYLNCPMDAPTSTQRFTTRSSRPRKRALHEFDDAKFFEGCLPIEVMAGRGVDTLRFGPMKPVGLIDPRTGREAYAVVQLRQDNLAGDHFSLVGFQTQMKWGEQARVLRLIPGLENAEFVRFGMIHRNTYINGPTCCATRGRRGRATTCSSPDRSPASKATSSRRRQGLMAGRNAAALVLGQAAARAAANDRARRARALRLARRSAPLPADQHHLRHHRAD